MPEPALRRRPDLDAGVEPVGGHRDPFVEMLFRLRHDAVVGGYREQHQIDAVRAGEHVADESVVPGNVNDPARVPSGRSRYAKPRSIEMPRSFSSFRRSVS
jgi:hypothetical protein